MAAVGDAARLLELPLTELEGLKLPAKSATVYCGWACAECGGERSEDGLRCGCHVSDAGRCGVSGSRCVRFTIRPRCFGVRGNASLLARPGIAVVGTRAPSPYGAGMAELLARDLANRRMAVFSGMARGVDTAAHKGALDAGGATLAVWGTGLDVIYPKENKPARRTDRGFGRDDHHGVSDGYVSGAAELSNSQPHVVGE